jgi:hypothetical protein
LLDSAYTTRQRQSMSGGAVPGERSRAWPASLAAAAQRERFEDLKPGLRIVANVGDGKAPLRAKAVEYAAAPATSMEPSR